MGEQRTAGGGTAAAGTGLEPGTPLTLAEAATLAGVAVEVIQAAVEDGTLLSERQRRGARERVVVRLFDLADVYPHVMGRPAEEASAPASVSAPAPAPASDPAADSHEPPTVPVPAASVPGADAPRAALVELCQDLETRLDLAERERQASTASLLMAQRRVLDLEARLRAGPWVRAAGIGAFVLALGALAVVLTLPGRVDAAVERRAGTLEARVAEVARDAETSAQELAAAAALREERLEALRTREVSRHADERRALEGALADVEARLEAAAAEAADRIARFEAREDELAERLRASEAGLAGERQQFSDLLDGYAKDLAAAREATRQESAERRREAEARAAAEAATTAALQRGIEDLERVSAEGRARIAALVEERRALEAAFRKMEQMEAERVTDDPEDEEPAPAAADPGSPWWRRLLGGR